MLLENELLRMELADNTCTVLSLEDKKNGTRFVSSRPETVFRVTENRKGQFLPLTAVSCHGEQTGNAAARLEWILTDGSVLQAQISLEGNQAAFTSSLRAAADSEVLLVEYPVIGCLGAWDEKMEMAHPFATGLLVHDPLRAFEEGEGIRYELKAFLDLCSGRNQGTEIERVVSEAIVKVMEDWKEGRDLTLLSGE